MLISKRNEGMLGPLKKTELDAMRKVRQLLSQFSIEKNVQDNFVYWAPELLVEEAVSKQSDMWAFGISMFLAYTGEVPFQQSKRESIFTAIVSSTIKWDLLAKLPLIQAIVKNLLVMDPAKRWTSSKLLLSMQEAIIVPVQRYWRRVVSKVRAVRRYKAIIFIQKRLKTFLAVVKYKRMKEDRRNKAAVKLQKFFKNYSQSKSYRNIKKAVKKIQAYVLGYQTRRVFLKMRKEVIFIQR